MLVYAAVTVALSAVSLFSVLNLASSATAFPQQHQRSDQGQDQQVDIRTFDVVSYGAKGDNVTDDSKVGSVTRQMDLNAWT